MATFTNYATLSYNGGSTNSNTVVGELVETLTASKTAVVDVYNANDSVTYVISLVNSGTSPLTDLTITDDLGGYSVDDTTVYPLAYAEGSVQRYVNGVLQAAPTATAGPPLTFSGITVPAGGNVILIYQADVTGYAPLAVDGIITNTVQVTGGGLATPITAQETVTADTRAILTISKAISPAVVTDNGQLTYTFVIENSGNSEAVTTDSIVVTDTFDPILSGITVTYNGTTWTEGVNYTYDQTTGQFATLPGEITVPAATFTQDASGVWTTTPGTAVLTVTGTV